MSLLSTRQEILEFEKQPLPTIPSSIHGVLKESASLYADRITLQFFLQGSNQKLLDKKAKTIF